VPGADDPLVERDRELGVLDRLLGTTGGAVLVEGPPGIGKSRLLRAARTSATPRRVISARGSEVERDVPFGVVRQLLEPVLVAASAVERDELFAGAAALAAPVLAEPASDVDEPGPASAAFHGLYWFTANLAAAHPLLVIVDDVHWADMASLRWLAHLAPRLEGLALSLLLAARPHEAGEGEELLDVIFSAPEIEVVRPGPLSPDAIARVAEAQLERVPDPRFVASCHAATGGNPFLVRELLRELASASVAPTAENAALVARQTSKTVSRAALARLRRLPSPCRALADAIVILGDGVDVMLAARLAELSVDEANGAADHLATASIFELGRPLGFVHPLVRSSVEAEMGAGARDRWQRRAAAQLAEMGAPAERIAVHLLATEPCGDLRTVEILRHAAGNARARGAADAVVSDLRRAWREPPPPELVGPVAFELGAAERQAGQLAAASEHLGDAMRAPVDARTRALAAAELGTTLMFTDRTEEAVAALSLALEGLADDERELGLRLESLRTLASEGTLAARTMAEAAGTRFPPPSGPPGTAAQRMSLVVAAHQAVCAQPAAQSLALVHRGLDGGHLLTDPGPGEPTFYLAALALLSSGAVEEATQLLTYMVEWAQRHGSVFAFAQAIEWRAVTWLRRGALAEAEADAELALQHSTFPVRPGVVTLLGVRLARGDVAGAARLWSETGMDGRPAASRGAVLHLHARAQLHLAQGRQEPALSDLQACGRLEEEWGVRTPALTTWRTDSARILAAMGRRDEALSLLDEEIARCRWFGTPAQLGSALRTAGVLNEGEAGLALLEESVTVLEPSPTRLLLASAQFQFGSALRRAGRRVDARRWLVAAIELAHGCGAEPLAHRAHDELVAAGARPRRDPIESRSQLTASELRVARLAADGMTNREIAQALFLTEKTIEVHLSSSYRKLDISSRSQLRRALPPVPVAS
jgi:DNA-binding CsgD family transcriptional regulator